MLLCMNEIIYRSTVDDAAWLMVVEATEDKYKGVLKVTNMADPSVVLLEEEVGLSYGAMFGPDTEDVAAWGQMTIAAIDQYIADHQPDEVF